ncbi:MAG: type II secretion system GspH family protein [Burkholderiaceae bacterium]|nr:type II secretion system GspH family protein [Burkholderiaceae bacterium]
MKKNQSGFTLIELIVVITILGILSAFALPRFAALQTDARIAKMNAALGSLKAAAALAHSVQLTQDLAPDASVALEGSVITMANGYPQSTNVSIGHAAGFATAAGAAFPEYVLASTATVFTVTPDASHPACAVTYTVPAAGSAPTYSNAAVTVANCT